MISVSQAASFMQKDRGAKGHPVTEATLVLSNKSVGATLIVGTVIQRLTRLTKSVEKVLAGQKAAATAAAITARDPAAPSERAKAVAAANASSPTSDNGATASTGGGGGGGGGSSILDFAEGALFAKYAKPLLSKAGRLLGMIAAPLATAHGAYGVYSSHRKTGRTSLLSAAEMGGGFGFMVAGIPGAVVGAAAGAGTAWLLNTTQDIWEHGKTSWGRVGAKIVSGWTRVWDRATDKISSSWESTRSFIADTGKSVIDGAKSAWESVTSGKALSIAGHMIQETWEGIKTSVSKYKTIIGEWMSRQGTNLNAWLDTVSTNLRAAISVHNLSSLALEWLGELKKWVLSKLPTWAGGTGGEESTSKTPAKSGAGGNEGASAPKMNTQGFNGQRHHPSVGGYTNTPSGKSPNLPPDLTTVPLPNAYVGPGPQADPTKPTPGQPAIGTGPAQFGFGPAGTNTTATDMFGAQQNNATQTPTPKGGYSGTPQSPAFMQQGGALDLPRQEGTLTPAGSTAAPDQGGGKQVPGDPTKINWARGTSNYSAENYQRAAMVMNAARSSGANHAAAAALAGNANVESQGFKSSAENNHGERSFGLFQLNGDRQDAFKNYAAQNKLNPYDHKVQVDYALNHEPSSLSKVSPKEMEEFKNGKGTSQQKSDWWLQHWERARDRMPGGQNSRERGALAGKYGDYYSKLADNPDGSKAVSSSPHGVGVKPGGGSAGGAGASSSWDPKTGAPAQPAASTPQGKIDPKAQEAMLANAKDIAKRDWAEGTKRPSYGAEGTKSMRGGCVQGALSAASAMTGGTKFSHSGDADAYANNGVLQKSGKYADAQPIGKDYMHDQSQWKVGDVVSASGGHASGKGHIQTYIGNGTWVSDGKQSKILPGYDNYTLHRLNDTGNASLDPAFSSGNKNADPSQNPAAPAKSGKSDGSTPTNGQQGQATPAQPAAPNATTKSVNKASAADPADPTWGGTPANMAAGGNSATPATKDVASSDTPTQANVSNTTTPAASAEPATATPAPAAATATASSTTSAPSATTPSDATAGNSNTPSAAATPTSSASSAPTPTPTTTTTPTASASASGGGGGDTEPSSLAESNQSPPAPNNESEGKASSADSSRGVGVGDISIADIASCLQAGATSLALTILS